MNTDIELEVGPLETAIARLLDEMSLQDCASDEYATMVDQLVKLYKAKETHVTLMLKEVETHTKRNESGANLTSRALEDRLKENESEANITAKENDSRIKQEELELRKEQAALANQVMELDTLLKQRVVERPWLPSNDTLAIMATNIVGIVMVIGHERASVIATKAFGFIQRLR